MQSSRLAVTGSAVDPVEVLIYRTHTDTQTETVEVLIYRKADVAVQPSSRHRAPPPQKTGHQSAFCTRTFVKRSFCRPAVTGSAVDFAVTFLLFRVFAPEAVSY